MKNKLNILGIVLCAIVFCISIFQVISHFTNAQRYTEEFKELAEIVEQNEDNGESDEEVAVEKQTTPVDRYIDLFKQNNDMAGWISIEGTNINYPVMYTPDNPEYYLKRSFKKEYSDYGVPYIAEHCDPIEPSDNLIIYGHHIKGGKMFGALTNYTKKAFYEQHKIIRFDTLTDIAAYEVVAVFKTTAYDDTGFKYYLFANAEKEEDFNAYIEECESRSLYDTGVSAEYGDRLITLSTCEYSEKNGRLVVVAKKIVE